MAVPAMRPSILVLITVFALFSLKAQARLGETPAQIEARYGKPTDTRGAETNDFVASYKHADYIIDVHFWNGKSAYEHLKALRPTDDQTAKTLFTKISGKEPTKIDKEKKGEGSITIYKADGVEGDFASFPMEGSYLMTVSTTDFRKHIDAVIAAEAKKKLDSF